jgi:hypothetical protein
MRQQCKVPKRKFRRTCNRTGQISVCYHIELPVSASLSSSPQKSSGESECNSNVVSWTMWRRYCNDTLVMSVKELDRVFTGKLVSLNDCMILQKRFIQSTAKSIPFPRIPNPKSSVRVMVLIKRDIDLNLDDHCHNPMELAQLLSSVLFTSGDLSDSLSRTTTGLHFLEKTRYWDAQST